MIFIALNMLRLERVACESAGGNSGQCIEIVEKVMGVMSVMM